MGTRRILSQGLTSCVSRFNLRQHTLGIGIRPGTWLWRGFQAVSLVAPRVVRLVALRTVAVARILVLAHPEPLEAAQEALPVATPGVSPDFRNRLTGKRTGGSSSYTSYIFVFYNYEHSRSSDDFNCAESVLKQGGNLRRRSAEALSSISVAMI